MVYTEEKDKKEIRTKLKAYLASKDLTFRKVVLNNEQDYNTMYARLFVGNIHLKHLESFLILINPKARLLSSSQGFVITDK